MTESDRLQQQIASGTLAEDEQLSALQRIIELERERLGIIPGVSFLTMTAAFNSRAQNQ